MPQSSSTKRRAGTETERMRLAWSSRWTEGRGRESVEEDDMERGKGGEAEGEVNKEEHLRKNQEMKKTPTKVQKLQNRKKR